MGGGIANTGISILEDSSSVVGNVRPGSGSGVFQGNAGSLTIRDSASIVGNGTADHPSGGVLSWGTVHMVGQSSIHDNVAQAGGGFANAGILTMAGSSSIPDNTAVDGGGGIWHVGGILNGVSCAPADGANVYDNEPDDCDGDAGWPVGGCFPAVSRKANPGREASPIQAIPHLCSALGVAYGY